MLGSLLAVWVWIFKQNTTRIDFFFDFFHVSRFHLGDVD